MREEERGREGKGGRRRIKTEVCNIIQTIYYFFKQYNLALTTLG